MMTSYRIFRWRESGHRDAFTMVEIAFALGIIVVAIVSVMLVLAGVQRSVQRSRLGFYAAVIAGDLTANFYQNQEDFRSTQDQNTPFVRGMARNKDGGVNDMGRDATRQLQGHGMEFATAGMFDWEIRALADKRIVPVPQALARRLDSPGDEIGRLLDAGGRLYYADPTGSEGEVAGAASQSGQANVARELTRLVFGVVGSAQQNILHNHPMIPQIRELYPFPPQGYVAWGNGSFYTPNYLRAWGRVESTGTPLTYDGPSQSVVAGDLMSVSYQQHNPVLNRTLRHWIDGYGNATTTSLYQRSTWEEQAYIDEVTGIPEANSPWRAGLQEFLRLDNYHWQRIYYQMSQYEYAKGNATITRQEPIYADVDVVVTERQITYDRLRQPTETTVNRTITEKQVVGFQDVTEPASGNWLYLRGVPTPALGLGTMQGARGTDILYEDAETLSTDRWNQLRVGLPGLERRVMYRTAAVALWAQVDGHGSVTEVPLSNLGDTAFTGNPNRIDPSLMPLARNPLLTRIPPPAGSLIHPAQVLALSYVAHAAIMATGYKPPFVDERNSVDPTQHQNLVPDESAPYKEPERGLFFLYHPFHAGNSSAAARSAINPTAEVVGTLPLFDAASGTAPAGTESVTNPLDPRIARDMSGNPIRYKRYQPMAPVLNPFPGPYADRGAFTWYGVPQFVRDPDTLRMTSHGMLGGGVLTDSEMARVAMENCLAWAMAYIRENSYCQIVPKPMNGPTHVDRPLFAFDIFDGSGNALRPPTPRSWNSSRNYGILWGSDQARWPAIFSGVLRINSFDLWNNSLFNDRGHADNPYNPIRSQETGSGPTDAVYMDPLALGQFSNLPMVLGNNRAISSSTKVGRTVREFRDSLNGWHQYPQVYNAAHGAADAARLRMSESPRRSRWWYDAPFSVADRTRQLVFWAVDWQAFEDAESQPSDPMDVSFFAINAGSGSANNIGSGSEAGNPFMRRYHAEEHLMWANPARDATHRNPPGSDTKYARLKATDGNNHRHVDQRVDHLGSGISFTSIVYNTGDPLPWARLGTWGADRNANGVWDRGRIPANARMSAVEVARFPFYDPVFWTTIGN